MSHEADGLCSVPWPAACHLLAAQPELDLSAQVTLSRTQSMTPEMGVYETLVPGAAFSQAQGGICTALANCRVVSCPSTYLNFITTL